jgi:hypothetical protein
MKVHFHFSLVVIIPLEISLNLYGPGEQQLSHLLFLFCEEMFFPCRFRDSTTNSCFLETIHELSQKELSQFLI